ncbi:Uncharacterised protein [Bordetella pertussis]|nr:Uncharacterised protein [Bordetella pertussis]
MACAVAGAAKCTTVSSTASATQDEAYTTAVPGLL